jgi:hypothetical protein
MWLLAYRKEIGGWRWRGVEVRWKKSVEIEYALGIAWCHEWRARERLVNVKDKGSAQGRRETQCELRHNAVIHCQMAQAINDTGTLTYIESDRSISRMRIR